MNLIDIFNKGLENDKCLGNKPRQFKVLIFLVITSLLSRFQRITESKLIWTNGKRGYEINFKDEKDAYFVFHGTAFKNIKNYKIKNSIFSNQLIKDRIVTLIKAYKFYRQHKKDIKSVIYWIEFYCIYTMINNSGIKKVLTTSIYDRHITWISYIALNLNINIEILQHGVVGSLVIKNKIFCTKIKCLNENQMNLLKKNVILNNSCSYEMNELKSVIVFSTYFNKELPLIGIASQCNKWLIDDLIKALLKIESDFIIILMLHPLEKPNSYAEYKGNSRIIVEPIKKYINLNLLITQHSTIVYDYIQNDFKGEIIQIDPGETICALDGIDKVIQFNRFDTLADYINKYLIVKKSKESSNEK